MFSGKTGAPVPSGIKADVATADKPTYGLARAAIEVVFNRDEPKVADGNAGATEHHVREIGDGEDDSPAARLISPPDPHGFIHRGKTWPDSRHSRRCSRYHAYGPRMPSAGA